MFKARLLSTFILMFIFSILPLASAQNLSSNPWGISLQPFVIYADSKGVLVGVDYDYYEEAGHFSGGILKPVSPWSYFVFYVNQSGVYYVNFTGFTGHERFPLVFYGGWLYLLIPTSAHVESPVKEPPVADTLLILRYREGTIQKLGEVPWLDGINISMPYILLFEEPNGTRVLYKIDGSVKLITSGDDVTLENRVNITDLPFHPGTLLNKACLRPVITGEYVLFSPSRYKIALGELETKFEPVNLSCAIPLDDGLLIVPPSIGVGFANDSMWIQPNTNYHSGVPVIVLHPDKERPQKPLNVSLYLYKKGRIEELPLFQVSNDGVRVLTPPIKYSKIAHKEWYRTQEAISFTIVLVVLVFVLVAAACRKR
ncbi:hypothetical protein [Thermococcus sp. 21S7]|uniref:hypothetical protein n=1 Tax=Thermococcus sp. 21S7 TaxID=1638221 RepID=UPI001438D772|nr:hypothetical protein [Thermococcus sp. 21S7]NJE61318.1 hypothetical protein [Thermococcus sp. 21S7]